MKGGDRMTRHDLKLITLLGVVLLAVAVFGALREGIDDQLRNLVRPDGPTRSGTGATPFKAVAGTTTVIDGDTLDIRNQRIRLHGIDAPESGQTCKNATGDSYRCGQRAALALADRIGRGTVTCRHRDTDRYGRVVAACSLAALDLGLWMVANGHALAYRRYSTDYAEQEDLARHTRRGLWAGSFVAPWDWRRGQR